MAESHNQVIEVPNIKAEVFKALLEYLYCDETEIKIEIALDLLRVANEYSLEKLKKKCGDFLKKNLQIDSAIEIANTACICEADDLKDATIEFILDYIDEINKIDDISKLNKTLLFELIVRGRY